MSFVRLNHHNG